MTVWQFLKHAVGVGTEYLCADFPGEWKLKSEMHAHLSYDHLERNHQLNTYSSVNNVTLALWADHISKRWEREIKWDYLLNKSKFHPQKDLLVMDLKDLENMLEARNLPITDREDKKAMIKQLMDQ